MAREPRGPGRPPLSATGERRVKAPINLTPTTLEEARRQAHARGLSLPSYLEQVIWEKHEETRRAQAVADTVKSLLAPHE